MSDFYSQVARYYDSENIGLIEDLPAYSLLVDRFGGPVLDVGCGTGRVALHLIEQEPKLRVIGLDASESMLERARRKAAEQNTPCEWLVGDVRDLALDEQFGLAIFAFSGFMHLLEHGEQIRALKQIAAHLKPGGGIAIDLANPIEVFHGDDIDWLVLARTFVDVETGNVVLQRHGGCVVLIRDGRLSAGLFAAHIHIVRQIGDINPKR